MNNSQRDVGSLLGNTPSGDLLCVPADESSNSERRTVLIETAQSASGPTTTTTMRPPSPSIPEKDFFFAALDQNARIDGRAFLDARSLELSFGAELGHVECSLGKTRYSFLLAHYNIYTLTHEGYTAC